MNITDIGKTTEELEAIVSSTGTAEDKKFVGQFQLDLEMLLNYSLDENLNFKEITIDSIDHITCLVEKAEDSLNKLVKEEYTRPYALKLKLDLSAFLINLTSSTAADFKSKLGDDTINKINGEEQVEVKDGTEEIAGTQPEVEVEAEVKTGADSANNNQTSGDEKMNTKQTTEEKLKAAKEEAAQQDEKTSKRNILKTTGIVLAGAAVIGAAVAAGYYYNKNKEGTTIIINNGSDE